MVEATKLIWNFILKNLNLEKKNHHVILFLARSSEQNFLQPKFDEQRWFVAISHINIVKKKQAK